MNSWQASKREIFGTDIRGFILVAFLNWIEDKKSIKYWLCRLIFFDLKPNLTHSLNVWQPIRVTCCRASPYGSPFRNLRTNRSISQHTLPLPLSLQLISQQLSATSSSTIWDNQSLSLSLSLSVCCTSHLVSLHSSISPFHFFSRASRTL